MGRLVEMGELTWEEDFYLREGTEETEFLGAR